MDDLATWQGVPGCCRHCNVGVDVCGKLNMRGFCRFCLAKGYDALYIDEQPTGQTQPITGDRLTMHRTRRRR